MLCYVTFVAYPTIFILMIVRCIFEFIIILSIIGDVICKIGVDKPDITLDMGSIVQNYIKKRANHYGKAAKQ